jgi:hypothetical protein
MGDSPHSRTASSVKLWPAAPARPEIGEHLDASRHKRGMIDRSRTWAAFLLATLGRRPYAAICSARLATAQDAGSWSDVMFISVPANGVTVKAVCLSTG